MARLEAEVVAEARVIVSGRVRVGLLRGGRSQPGPSWISELAHANWNHLEWLADTRTLATPWRAAVSYLADEIRTEARAAGGLLAIQRDRLIPLEQDVLAGRAAPPTTPLDLIRMVRTQADMLRQLPEDTSPRRRIPLVPNQQANRPTHGA